MKDKFPLTILINLKQRIVFYFLLFSSLFLGLIGIYFLISEDLSNIQSIYFLAFSVIGVPLLIWYKIKLLNQKIIFKKDKIVQLNRKKVMKQLKTADIESLHIMKSPKEQCLFIKTKKQHLKLTDQVFQFKMNKLCDILIEEYDIKSISELK